MDTELIGQHVHGSATFVASEQSLQLISRQSPLDSSRGLSFGLWRPRKLKLEDLSNAILLVSVV